VGFSLGIGSGCELPPSAAAFVHFPFAFSPSSTSRRVAQPSKRTAGSGPKPLQDEGAPRRFRRYAAGMSAQQEHATPKCFLKSS
jgi:hypothetical protein